MKCYKSLISRIGIEVLKDTEAENRGIKGITFFLEKLDDDPEVMNGLSISIGDVGEGADFHEEGN